MDEPILKRVKVEVYSKPQCALCDEALAIVREVQGRIPFELIEIDVSGDPALRRELRYDLPLVCINGRRALKHRFTSEALVAELERAWHSGC